MFFESGIERGKGNHGERVFGVVFVPGAAFVCRPCYESEEENKAEGDKLLNH